MNQGMNFITLVILLYRNYIRKFHQQIFFFYWIEDSKTYAHADASQNFNLAWPYTTVSLPLYTISRHKVP